MVQAAMAGPDTVRQDIIQKAFLSVSLDISKVINSYSSFDWPIVAAALSIAGPALKADLNPEGQELVDDFLTDAQAIHYKTPKRARGGVIHSRMEVDPCNPSKLYAATRPL